MRKYIKPIAKVIIMDNEVILAGSVDVDPNPINGDNVGAKRGSVYSDIYDDEYDY